jgi:hypothetical protein
MGKSAPSATNINPSKEYSKILDLTTQKTIPAWQDFTASQPLLQGITTLANQQMNQLPGMQGQLTTAYNKEQANLPWATNLVKSAYAAGTPEANLANTLKSAYGAAVPVGQLTSPLMATYKNYLNPILQSGGALTGQLSRQASQDALKYSGLGGMATTNPALFGAALNRDVYRQQRYGTALNQALGLTQDVSGLDTAAMQRALGYAGGVEALNQGGLNRALTAGQGVTGLGQQGFQNTLNYLLGRTGLTGTTMGDLASAFNTGVGGFTQLLDPASSVVSSATNFNANARAAAANAGANQTNSLIGTAGSVIGSIAIAY